MKSINIVLIEDHAILRESLKDALEHNTEIKVAGHWGSGENALPFFCNGKCDVAVIDLALPGMDGITLAKNIKKLNKDISIIILSMALKEETIFEAFKAGVSAYIPKESGTEELIDAIRKVSNGESVISDRITKKFIQFCTSINEKSEMDKTLSEIQVTMLQLASEGQANKEIALKLGLPVSTIKNQFREIFEKLNACDRTQAVVIAIKEGIISIG